MQIEFTKSDMTRFVTVEAPTMVELIDAMNKNHEGMARLIYFGENKSATGDEARYIAVFDRALQVIMTLEDAIYAQDEHEHEEDSTDTVLKETKLNMAA